jgi:hypothetical protein
MSEKIEAAIGAMCLAVLFLLLNFIPELFR